MFVLRGTVYHFRRRVPVFLRGALGKSEIWLSLRTSSWRLAKARASALYVLTEKIFRGAEAMITEDGLVDSALFVAKYLQCVAEQIAGIGNWPPGDIGSQLEEIEENLVQLEQRFDTDRKRIATVQQELQDVVGVVGGAWQDDIGIKVRTLTERTKVITANISGRTEGHAGEAPIGLVLRDLAEMRADMATLKEAVAKAPPMPPGEVPAVSPPEDLPKEASAYIEPHVKAKVEGGWTEQTKSQQSGSIDLFLAIAGNKPLADYTREDIARYREILQRVPYNHGKSSTNRDLGVTVFDEIAQADASQEPVRRLSRTTLDRHWSEVKSFLETANVHAKPDERFDPAILQKHVWSKDVPPAQKRKMWSTEALTTLFSSPVYTGCAGSKRSDRWTPGTVVIKDAYYWLPLLGLFTGAREEELARLRVEDVRDHMGVVVIDITPKGYSRIKSPSSVRKVPVHKTLVKLGFLDHCRRMAKQGQDRIFPDLKPDGPDDKLGRNFSDFFTKYRQHAGVYAELMDFQSLRTTFSTYMLRLGHPILTVDELTGHDSAQRKEVKALQSVTVSNYYDGAAIQALRDAVNAYDPGINLEHLYKSR